MGVFTHIIHHIHVVIVVILTFVTKLQIRIILVPVGIIVLRFIDYVLIDLILDDTLHIHAFLTHALNNVFFQRVFFIV